MYVNTTRENLLSFPPRGCRRPPRLHNTDAARAGTAEWRGRETRNEAAARQENKRKRKGGWEEEYVQLVGARGEGE